MGREEGDQVIEGFEYQPGFEGVSPEFMDELKNLDQELDEAENTSGSKVMAERIFSKLSDIIDNTPTHIANREESIRLFRSEIKRGLESKQVTPHGREIYQMVWNMINEKYGYPKEEK